MKHVRSYRYNYPRPQFVRDDWVSLNGQWDFCFDRENKGERSQYFLSVPCEHVITVPFSYHTEASGVNVKDRVDNIWYGRTFSVPSAWEPSSRIFVNFEGSDYVTKLWVNGVFVTEHRGGYTRFSADITDYLKPDSNYIAVKTEDSFDLAQPRGKQRWQDVSSGCFYEETCGLWKSVWMEPRAHTHLLYTSIDPNFDESKVEMSCEISELCSGLTLETTVFCDDVVICRAENAVLSKDFRTCADIGSSVDFFRVRKWTPNNPQIYDVRYVLKQNGTPIDTVSSYFGMRKISIRNDDVMLNNESLYLKMVLHQGYYDGSHLTPNTEEELMRDIQTAKDMGFNCIRMHQKIEDERFYYYCDILGMLVWCEMPSFYAFNRRSVQDFTEQWTDAVLQNRNHPSIMVWVPFNESWGLFEINTDAQQQAFSQSIYYLTKTLDGQGRPVVTNDGWEHTLTDIVTLHLYAETPATLDCYRDKDRVINDAFLGAENFKSAHMKKKTFVDGYTYQGQPIMISEFGGVAFSEDAVIGAWGYGNGAKDRTDLFNKIRALNDVIKTFDYVCGYCLTQLTDVSQEINGLMTISRSKKIQAEKMRLIND